MKRAIIILLLLLAAFIPSPGRKVDVSVGSKKFTESVILGEMLRGLSQSTGATVQHYRELGGTRLVFESLRTGEIDAYVEYTGTLINEIFADQNLTTDRELKAALKEQGVGISRPVGFNNTYALGMLSERAESNRVESISDLSGIDGLKYGLGNEFYERADGWRGLKEEYKLTPADVRGLDHDVAWRQLELGQVDVIDIYTTEARIDALGVTVLRDDRSYFPRYDAVILYRLDFATKFPGVMAEFERLVDSVSPEVMTALNRQAEIDGVAEVRVASDFLLERFNVEMRAVELTATERFRETTWQHLELVRRSLLPAILVAIPLGIVSARIPWFGHICLAVTGIFQTIPSFALLVLLLPLASLLGLQSIGAGSATAITALFLYSLLPVVRNTHSGLTGIDASLRESAEVLNLPPMYRLMNIELPLAARSIFAGIKTAAVMNIGFATLGALVGAGGYGQPILSGIRLARTSLILEGAIPAALLALLVQGCFEFYERRYLKAV